MEILVDTYNWFDKAAKYLYAYSGTMSFLEWKDIVKQLYKEQEKQLGISGAQAMVIAMVAYYCIEVGQMYKGRQAASKFKSCNRWPDFFEPDAYWKEEWELRKKDDEAVMNVEKLLFSIGKTIPPDKIEYSNWSRDALYELLGEVTFRHGEEIAKLIEPDLRNLISIYSGWAIINLAKQGKLRDRQLIPNMVTTYFIQRALVKQYGEILVDMKMAELEGRC
jgi:hypothetical protein